MMNSLGVEKQVKRKIGSKGHKRGVISPSVVLGALFLLVIVVYITVVTWFSVSSSSPLHGTRNNKNKQSRGENRRDTKNIQAEHQAEAGTKEKHPNHMKKDKIGSPAEEKGLNALMKIVKDENRQPIVKKFVPKPKLEGIKPQVLIADAEKQQLPPENEVHPDPKHIMKAYVEPIQFEDWEIKPLPPRTTAKKEKLQEIAFPRVNSCKRLPERWPADEYPDQDTFLPWIHDVFPTDDGKFIQFVAENRRRCHSGTTEEELRILFKTQPSVALFQHVPVKRIKRGKQTRYKLCPHNEADPDGVATRFICRFKPTMEETLSVFNFDYDWASARKKAKYTFRFDDGGIKAVHTSQLLFKCPVPAGLQEKIRSGESVKNDFATLFVDVVPIRTPPRYGAPKQFLQPRYNESLPEKESDRFDPAKEWGDEHILPLIEDSGRWENIPICRPSFQEFYPKGEAKGVAMVPGAPPKKHRLVSCMWASAGYSTRGNRFAINDGQRRLLEWIHFNKLIGFEHFYLYDNSYAFSNDITLKPIADLFPDEVTYIKWPFQVCNNNPNNVDSPGERSSQYAAEASCRLRFGPHVEWVSVIGQQTVGMIEPLLNWFDYFYFSDWPI
jgi:Glycosyltransferase family 92